MAGSPWRRRPGRREPRAAQRIALAALLLALAWGFVGRPRSRPRVVVMPAPGRAAELLPSRSEPGERPPMAPVPTGPAPRPEPAELAGQDEEASAEPEAEATEAADPPDPPDPWGPDPFGDAWPEAPGQVDSESPMF